MSHQHRKNAAESMKYCIMQEVAKTGGGGEGGAAVERGQEEKADGGASGAG